MNLTPPTVRLQFTLKVLKLFENMKLRRKFQPTKQEVAAGWRKVHKQETDNVHSPPYKVLK